MRAGFEGRNNLRAHLSRWIQAYGMQPAQMHIALTLENRNNKWKQERQNAPNIIHGEAFDKMCNVLNRVHHVRRTD